MYFSKRVQALLYQQAPYQTLHWIHIKEVKTSKVQVTTPTGTLLCLLLIPPFLPLPPTPIAPPSPRGFSGLSVDLLYSALLAAGGSRAGEPPDNCYHPTSGIAAFRLLYSHFISFIHRNWPLTVGEVHPLPDLCVQGWWGWCNFHTLLHPHPALVMMDTVQPQYRFLQIPRL